MRALKKTGDKKQSPCTILTYSWFEGDRPSHLFLPVTCFYPCFYRVCVDQLLYVEHKCEWSEVDLIIVVDNDAVSTSLFPKTCSRSIIG